MLYHFSWHLRRKDLMYNQREKKPILTISDFIFCRLACSSWRNKEKGFIFWGHSCSSYLDKEKSFTFWSHSCSSYLNKEKGFTFWRLSGNSWMNMPAVPDCDCGGMLECLGILRHRQGCEAQRRLLAEGELGRRSVRVRKRKCRMPRDSYNPEPEQSGTAGIFIPRPGIHPKPTQPKPASF